MGSSKDSTIKRDAGVISQRYAPKTCMPMGFDAGAQIGSAEVLIVLLSDLGK